MLRKTKLYLKCESISPSRYKAFRICLLPLVLLSLATPASALTVNGPFAFTENFGPNVAGFSTGHVFQIGADVSDPLGVPGNITSVTATQPLNPPFSIPFLDIGAIGTAKYNLVKPYEGESGEWDINVENNQGEIDTVTTHALDDIHVIPLANNLTATGNSLAPLIAWDPVLFDHDNSSSTADVEVDFYRVRLVNSPDDQFFRSAPLTDNSFQIPSGIIVPGITNIRLVAWDLDDGFLENKSSTFIQLNAIPIPATLPLFASALGLLGFTVWKKKKAA